MAIGQCDARPTVAFPAADHHCPLAGTKLYCLVTEAQGCEQLAQRRYLIVRCTLAVWLKKVVGWRTEYKKATTAKDDQSNYCIGLYNFTL